MEWLPPLEALPLLVLPSQRHPNTRHLHRASLFRISQIGTCLLLRLPHPGDYLQLQEASLASGDRIRLDSQWGNTIEHKRWWAHGLQANGPRHCLCWCCVLPRWHCQSVSHDQATLLLLTSRRCSHQEGQWREEWQLNSPLTELLPQPVNPPRTVEGSRPGDGVSEASQPVTQGVHKGQQQMFPRLPPQEPPSPNQADVQSTSTPSRCC